MAASKVQQLLSLSVDSLRQQLAEDNAYFDSLLRRIRPQFYLSRDDDDAAEADAKADKYVFNRKNKPSEQQLLKEKTKKALKLKGVPLNRPGIPELQAQEAEEEEEEAAAAAAAAAAEAEEEDHDEEMNGSAGSGEDESRGDADSDDDRKKSFAKDAHTNAAATAANSVSVKDMGEQLGGAEMGRNSVRTAGVNLQQKLREAIAAKSAKRAHPGEKPQREKTANKKRKLREERQSKPMVRAPLPPLTKRAKTADGAASDDEDGDKLDKTVAFSKFDFGNEKKKPKGRPTPQQLLQKVEQQHKRMKELEKEDAAKAGDIAEKAAWAKAMQRAEGEKVFDDPALIKKKIKHIERSKKKSAKEWNERNDEVEKSIKERQDRRNKNLKERVKKKLDKRRERAAKRRPGFVKGSI